TGRWRDHLSRRDRRAARGSPGETAPRAPGARVRPGGRRRPGPRRCPRHRRHQPRPAPGGAGKAVPRGPVLPPERLPPPPAPLRERPGDIPLLVHFLVNKFAPRVGKRLDEVSRATMQRLQEYPWPGNVRELENVLERAVILATGQALEVAPDLLPAPAKIRPVEERAQTEGAGDAPLAPAAPP